jgi:hypothetical protein
MQLRNVNLKIKRRAASDHHRRVYMPTFQLVTTMDIQVASTSIIIWASASGTMRICCTRHEVSASCAVQTVAPAIIHAHCTSRPLENSSEHRALHLSIQPTRLTVQSLCGLPNSLIMGVSSTSYVQSAPKLQIRLLYTSLIKHTTIILWLLSRGTGHAISALLRLWFESCFIIVTTWLSSLGLLIAYSISIVINLVWRVGLGLQQAVWTAPPQPKPSNLITKYQPKLLAD